MSEGFYLSTLKFPPMQKLQKISKNIEEVEKEVKHLGLWTNEPFDEKLLINMGAFGRETMPFPMWLQFVFIPQIRKLIEANQPLPGNKKSEIGVYANREFDTQPEYARLISLLCKFDKLCGNPYSFVDKYLIISTVLIILAFFLILLLLKKL